MLIQYVVHPENDTIRELKLTKKEIEADKIGHLYFYCMSKGLGFLLCNLVLKIHYLTVPFLNVLMSLSKLLVYLVQ